MDGRDLTLAAIEPLAAAAARRRPALAHGGMPAAAARQCAAAEPVPKEAPGSGRRNAAEHRHAQKSQRYLACCDTSCFLICGRARSQVLCWAENACPQVPLHRRACLRSEAP